MKRADTHAHLTMVLGGEAIGRRGPAAVDLEDLAEVLDGLRDVIAGDRPGRIGAALVEVRKGSALYVLDLPRAAAVAYAEAARTKPARASAGFARMTARARLRGFSLTLRELRAGRIRAPRLELTGRDAVEVQETRALEAVQRERTTVYGRLVELRLRTDGTGGGVIVRATHGGDRIQCELSERLARALGGHLGDEVALIGEVRHERGSLRMDIEDFVRSYQKTPITAAFAALREVVGDAFAGRDAVALARELRGKV